MALLPREHGAYGQLALPLLTALVIVARPPQPARLRTIGWTLVAVSALTAAIIVASA
jgi:hypothetical protein